MKKKLISVLLLLALMLVGCADTIETTSDESNASSESLAPWQNRVQQIHRKTGQRIAQMHLECLRLVGIRIYGRKTAQSGFARGNGVLSIFEFGDAAAVGVLRVDLLFHTDNKAVLLANHPFG